MYWRRLFLRVQIQHLLACDHRTGLRCAAIAIADSEAVFAGGEVVHKLGVRAGTPEVGIRRGAGGDFREGDDAVVGTSAGGCGRQEEGVYDGAFADFSGEGDGAAVGVENSDFIQTWHSHILRVLLGRGVALRARPLKGERAGSAVGDYGDAAGGGGAADAVNLRYADFGGGSGERQEEKSKGEDMGFEIFHVVRFWLFQLMITRL